MTNRFFGVSLALLGGSLLSGCAMEVQAQEEMVREVACDVVFRTGEPGPGQQVVENRYADVGDEAVVRVNAELRDRDVSEEYVMSPTAWPESRLTTEAIRVNGRTLVHCGTGITTYQADGEVFSDRFSYYQRAIVATSRTR